MHIWAMLLTGQVFSVGCPAGTLAYFCQWVLLHCWLTLMWRSRKMSSLLGRYDFPRCYRPIPLSCGGTNWCNILAITPCVGVWSFHQEAWKPCLLLVLDHNNVNWWWRLYDLKGHSSASNHSQTIRYSKIPIDLAKKGPFKVENCFVNTGCVYASY